MIMELSGVVSYIELEVWKFAQFKNAPVALAPIHPCNTMYFQAG